MPRLGCIPIHLTKYYSIVLRTHCVDQQLVQLIMTIMLCFFTLSTNPIFSSYQYVFYYTYHIPININITVSLSLEMFSYGAFPSASSSHCRSIFNKVTFPLPSGFPTLEDHTLDHDAVTGLSNTHQVPKDCPLENGGQWKRSRSNSSSLGNGQYRTYFGRYIFPPGSDGVLTSIMSNPWVTSRSQFKEVSGGTYQII